MEDHNDLYSNVLHEERPLIEFPIILKIFAIIFFLIISAGLLVFPWYITAFLFFGFCFSIAVFFNLYIGTLIFIAGAYLHPTVLFPALQDFHIARNLAFGVIFIWGFHTIVYRDFKLVKAPQNLIIVLFSLLFFASTFMEFDYSFPLFIEIVSKAVILYFAVANIVKTRFQLIFLLWFLFILGFVSASVGIVQYIMGIGLREGTSVRIMGLTENPNTLAAELVFLVPVLIGLFRCSKKMLAKGVIFLFFSLIAAGIILTYSRAGMLALVFVSFLAVKRFMFRRLNAFIALIIAVIILAILIFVLMPFLPDEYKDRMQTITETREASIRSRFDAWVVAWDTIVHHPLVGVGPGVFQREFVYNAITSPGIKTKFLLLHAHNLYLNVAAESGLPAVAMLILLIYFSWRYFRNSSFILEKKGDIVLSNISAGFEISIVGFSLMNMVSSHIEALIFWILLGISVVLMELSNDK